MNGYTDLSCMQLDDEKYSKTKQGFSAKLSLICDTDKCKKPCDKKNSLAKNMPISYDNGVFRIQQIVETSDHTSMVAISGAFSEDDPNGQELNGWTSEELNNSSSKEFTSSVESLEV